MASELAEGGVEDEDGRCGGGSKEDEGRKQKANRRSRRSSLLMFASFAYVCMSLSPKFQWFLPQTMVSSLRRKLPV